jgi:ribose/xylose/arabinose/galactoside ABC-type transport system permease subunit
MAYDDSRFRGEPGFREEPDFRVPDDGPTLGGSPASVYTPGAYPVGDYGPAVEPPGRRSFPSPAQLGDVFDDPEHGDPGRDRMTVHALWEMVLLLGAAALIYLLRDADQTALRGTSLQDLMLTAAEVGALAVGMGLTLRAGAPNLAVGPIALASALFFADQSSRGLLVTASITALLAVAIGAVIAVLVTAFHVPGWAASLGVALLLIVWIQQHHPEHVANGAYDPHSHAIYWAAGIALLSLGGGLLGLVKPIRRAVGRFRPVADPSRRRGGAAATYTGLAIIGSSLLAAVTGILIALGDRDVGPGDNGLAFTGLALGAALLGGTSVFGRRGGVLGTVLAVALIVLLMRYADAEKWRLPDLTIAAFAIFAGLVVSRLVETFGRPKSVFDEQEEAAWAPSQPPVPVPEEAPWTDSHTGGWTSQLPARATDEGWGTEERWSTR